MEILTKTPTTQAKKSILIIDDSLDILILNKELLEMNNYEVFTAQSGREGLDLISKIKPPDLVLLDMQMDDMTGTEFLQILEKEKPDFMKKSPVVFLTGMDEIPQSKASGYIPKACGMKAFLDGVQHFIEKNYNNKLCL